MCGQLTVLSMRSLLFHAGPLGQKCIELSGESGSGKVTTTLHVVRTLQEAAAEEGTAPIGFGHIKCEPRNQNLIAKLLQVSSCNLPVYPSLPQGSTS